MTPTRQSRAIAASILAITAVASAPASAQQWTTAPGQTQPWTVGKERLPRVEPFSTARPTAPTAPDTRGQFTYVKKDAGAPGLANLTWTRPTGSAAYLAWVGNDFERTLEGLQAQFNRARAEMARTDVPGGPYRSDAHNVVLREAVARANSAMQQSELSFRRYIAAVPNAIQIFSQRPSVPAGREIPVSVSAQYTDGSLRSLHISSPLVSVEAPARLTVQQSAGASSFGPTLRTLAPGKGKVCVQLRSPQFPSRSCIDVTVTAPELADLVVVPVSIVAAPVAPVATTAAKPGTAPTAATPGTAPRVTPATTPVAQAAPVPVPVPANVSTPTLPLGSRLQLSVRGRFTDESVQALPATTARAVTWSVVPSNVATVDSNGVVTCRVGGSQIINVKAYVAQTPQWLAAERAEAGLGPRELFGMSHGLNGGSSVICK